MKDVVLRFVTLPMTIKVFREDKKNFSESKIHVLYYDLIDAVLEKLESDFRQLKAEMYMKHHLDVRYLGKEGTQVKYRVNKEVITFTPDELKEKTEELMREYLTDIKFERSERVWEH